jgi:REP element-mobilizing transposase RayT
LHRYQIAQSAPPTVLAREVFEVIGKAALENLRKQRYAVEAIAVTPTHVHMLAEVPYELDRLHEMFGWLKRFATRAARQRCSALESVEIWAEGQTLKIIDDDQHWRATREYILTKQGSDAWTWEKTIG